MKRSKWVSEIIKDLNKNPESWEFIESNFLVKNNIKISDCHLYINEEDLYFSHTTFLDRVLLGFAYLKWIRNAPLNKILNK